MPKALVAVESGQCDLVSIAQIYQRSGTRSVSWKDSNITSPADFKGKKVGVWDFGNEFEVTAAAKKAGLESGTDFEKIIQPFDMTLLLSKQIDVAEAMIYNEYAQVLEAENPDTGELYQPEDLNVIDWNDVGTAMLQDAIWASTERLDDEAYAEQTVAFIKASIKGWAFVRDNPEDAAAIVAESGSELGQSHQLWMANEVNKLIWPSTNGVGIIDEDAWAQTVDIALNTENETGATIITDAPPESAYTNEYVEEALDELREEGVDVDGADFTPIDVTLNEGGS